MREATTRRLFRWYRHAPVVAFVVLLLALLGLVALGRLGFQFVPVAGTFTALAMFAVILLSLPWAAWVEPWFASADPRFDSPKTPRDWLRSIRSLMLVVAGALWVIALATLIASVYQLLATLLDSGAPAAWRDATRASAQRFLVIGLVFTLPAIAATLISVFVYRAVRRRLRRNMARQRICFDCGYDLRGTADVDGATCPECGAPAASQVESQPEPADG